MSPWRHVCPACAPRSCALSIIKDPPSSSLPPWRRSPSSWHPVSPSIRASPTPLDRGPISFPCSLLSSPMVMAAASTSIGPQTSRLRFLSTSLHRLISSSLLIQSSFHRLPTISCSPRGMCHVTHAVKPGGGGTDALLKGVPAKATADAVRNFIELARRASSRREILHTDFLTPPVVKESLWALEKLANIKAVAREGYPQAERCPLSVGHPKIMIVDLDVVAALSITGNFGFQPRSHGDFLGSTRGTGTVREKLGDILLQGEKKRAQVLVVQEFVEFLTSALDKVGNVTVTCTQMPLLALEYEPPKTRTFKTVETSLRVDALASAGFKISRSKLVKLISIALVCRCSHQEDNGKIYPLNVNEEILSTNVKA